MNTKRTHKIASTVLASVVALSIALLAEAKSTAELLEKGIYTEQTVGDLAAAIEIYKQVVETAEANRLHLAQAQYRLGMCYLKSGRAAEGESALNRLIREFPEQKQLVARAREELAAAKGPLALEGVPWIDGETLRYRMSLPTGKEIGSIRLKAESIVIDGTDAWLLELRRFVATNSDNYGVSRVLVDRDTQRPIRSTIRHGLLGNADAIFGPDGVVVTAQGSETRVDSHQDVYDNDQSMHLMRMLPLEPGYETTLTLVPIWTAQITEIGLKVKGKENCKVPVGEVECYKVALDNGETYWFSTGPERYPLKLKGGGIELELAEIGRTEPGAEVAFSLEGLDFSASLPHGWLPHVYRTREDQARVRLLDPEAAAISSIEVDRCPRGKCPELQKTAERELAGAKKRFQAYKLREGSWTNHTIAGHPAIGFVGDYTRNKQPWVQYRVYSITEDLRLELIFRVQAAHFERLREEIDSILDSLAVE